MFFRKKRYSEVEGYERISRMIEDRQAEAGVEMEEGEELYEEDTVVLTREPRDSSRAAPAASDDRPTEDQAFARPTSDVQESVTVVRPADRASGEAPPIATTPDAVTAAMAVPPLPATPRSAVLESPAIPFPDLTSLSAQAGSASLIAKDAVWEGKLVCNGNVRVDGALRGEIETSGTVFVSADARVDGTIRAQNVTLAGEVQGIVRCDGRLEILPGGAARGDVDTGALVVHEGAFIESRFQMRPEHATAS